MSSVAKEEAGPGPDKRSRLTSAALELAYRQGYQRSTIADIADEASVPLGNVYYYFKTKDDIGYAIIDRRLWEFAQLRERLDKLDNAKERLLGFIDMTLNNRATVAVRGCPFGSISAEFLKLGGELATRSKAMLAEPLAWMEAQFRQLGQGDKAFALAVHLQSTLRGVSLLAQSFGDPRLIEIEAEHLKDWLAAM
jgi:TetR/AcrR family transcriptional repressor of nem operon